MHSLFPLVPPQINLRDEIYITYGSVAYPGPYKKNLVMQPLPPLLSCREEKALSLSTAGKILEEKEEKLETEHS